MSNEIETDTITIGGLNVACEPTATPKPYKTEAEKEKAVKAKRLGENGKDKEVVDWKNVDPQIEHRDSKIILPAEPEKMPIDEAIIALKRKKKDEEQIIHVIEQIDAMPFDAAVSFLHAMKFKYGWASPVPTKGFFGEEPPRMMTIDVGPEPEDKIQVPWGAFMLPGVSNPVEIDSHYIKGTGPVLIVGAMPPVPRETLARCRRNPPPAEASR